ncbi:MAG: DMT family transporter [Polymorphobacter sp.]|uniref:DMT family transporter n=1 Tax=Polymorphobacter sp. TaxID=1909290 RepID=UPI003A84C64E
MSPRALALLQCITGIGALTLMDALVKWLAQTIPTELITFGRHAAGTVIALAVWQMQRRPAINRAAMRLHFARGALITLSGLTFFYAIDKLPLAEALTIAFVAPLMIPPLARLFLGERIRRAALTASLIGFAGVLVAVQGAPDQAESRTLAIIAALFAATTYAGSAIVLRALAGQERATAITLLGSVVPLLLLSPVLLFHGPPGPVGLLGFVGLGILGNIGMQLLARAYAALESQVSAVMEFTALPWAALLGFLLFGDGVRLETLAGAAIILAAVLIASRPEPSVRPADPQSSP